MTGETNSTEKVNIYRLGIDIGSTTVKLAVLDGDGNTLYQQYTRHQTRTREALAGLLRGLKSAFPDDTRYTVCFTGSGAGDLHKAVGAGFIQEVVAEAAAVRAFIPQADIAVELGGEDAKLLYFGSGAEAKMNGVCAGGTGAFIDQMALLLQTDAQGLNELAKGSRAVYHIASRCGVFAKSDLQPLINEGVSREDLAASVFYAVVNQTVSGLACGRPIRGKVAFLGGPLCFLSELRNAFIKTLDLSSEEVFLPEHAHLYPAIGAALLSEKESPLTAESLLKSLEESSSSSRRSVLAPLFKSREEYGIFVQRHERARVLRGRLSDYSGRAYLGIDAGSTTVKLALIGERGELLFSHYAKHNGSPVNAVKDGLSELAGSINEQTVIAYSCATGYGESLVKAAFGIDDGEVETVAHWKAASFFEPEVDSLIDIGGQDIKYIRKSSGRAVSVMLNEACSSGCGGFLENFAQTLGLDIAGSAELAAFAQHPADLGIRCTVFMNSNVKHAQKEGVAAEDIAAGLVYSVVKNALYKVVKVSDASELGEHIVVQGGTFYNRAVLRAFELIAGHEVVCPDISGIMGAFGAALIARERSAGKKSGMVSLSRLSELQDETTSRHCGGCENDCLLTVHRFSNRKTHISGNRCERMAREDNADDALDMTAFKLKTVFDFPQPSGGQALRGTIGIPRVLNIYEDYPFWAVFFNTLGFSVVLSPVSDRAIYELGIESIPSESLCYPAKLCHGHVKWLLDRGVRTIFFPFVPYAHKEQPAASDCYNCPLVSAYSENLKNNISGLCEKNIRFLQPVISFADKKTLFSQLEAFCLKEWKIPSAEVRRAAAKARDAQLKTKALIKKKGAEIIKEAKERDLPLIVLAGRPYHIDPGINHGIPEQICAYGAAVLTEDSLPEDNMIVNERIFSDQWVYHARLYSAADFVCSGENIGLVQLNSFGCGLDAVTMDQLRVSLDDYQKPYTVIRIDEMSELGAARIRIRSLLAALKEESRQSRDRK